MSFYYFAISLTILSNVLYHVCQKSITTNVNPIISLITTYISAIVIALVILPLYPGKVDFINSFKGLNWASFTLGAAIVGLELGFLLAYRAGWNINLAALVSTVAVAIFLIPIGMYFFKETLNIMNVLGIVFCIVGLFLIKCE